MEKSKRKPRLEVADILRLYGDEYRNIHRPSANQRAVMRHIESCRTAALGSHKDTCDTCGHIRISYNSCRDRHCPKCQNLKKAEWLETRRERLLPTAYFHVVFTLPDKLNPLALRNKRIVFDTLFEAAAATIQTIARDEKHLGAEVGFTAILHTWGQNLLFHPHLHCVVTGGGLDRRGHRWVKGSTKFFLPVKVMGRLFRGKFLHALHQAYQEGRLQLEGTTQVLQNSSAWKKLFNKLYDVDWVVFAKPPFGGPEHVFRYLGRYTHRVAISNHRLLVLQNRKVSFLIRDHIDKGKRKILGLDATEFIRRFLLHVLPKKFVRIRHYGLLASRNIKSKLQRARQLLDHTGRTLKTDSSSDSKLRLSWWEKLLKLTGVDIMACPICERGRFQRGPMHRACVPIMNGCPSNEYAFDTS